MKKREGNGKIGVVAKYTLTKLMESQYSLEEFALVGGGMMVSTEISLCWMFLLRLTFLFPGSSLIW